MFIPIFLVTAVITSIGFVSGEISTIFLNPIFTYYLYVLKFFLHNPIIFIVGLGTLFIFTGRIFRVTVQITLLGLILSPFLLFIVAFLELTVLSILYTHFPDRLSILTNTESIIASLNHFTAPPKIITNKPSRKSHLVAIARASSGQDTFFGDIVIPSFPS